MEPVEHTLIRVIWQQTTTFSRHMVVEAADVMREPNRGRVDRLFRVLERMKLVLKYPKSYQYRNWKVAPSVRLTPVDEIIEMYDAWCTVHKGEIR